MIHLCIIALQRPEGFPPRNVKYSCAERKLMAPKPCKNNGFGVFILLSFKWDPCREQVGMAIALHIYQTQGGAK